MTSVLGYAPIAAAVFGVPQFLPQMLKLRATRDSAGLSWSWAALTTVNNAAWIGYFALSGYWTALVASCSVTVLAGALTVMLTGRVDPNRRSLAVIGGWAATLAGAFLVAGRAGLGTLLAVAFVVQVGPSLWAAYRTEHPTGISVGTWTLILGELACFLIYGLYKSDPRLVALGCTGVIASTLMLGRILFGGHGRARRRRVGQWRHRPADHPAPADWLNVISCGLGSPITGRATGMATDRQKEAARRNIAKAREAQSARAHGEDVPRPSEGMSTAEEDRLEDQEFAFPRERKEPLTDARHVRNAIARFDQVEGVSDAERDQAWERILAAARRYDVEVSEADWRDLAQGGKDRGS